MGECLDVDVVATDDSRFPRRTRAALDVGEVRHAGRGGEGKEEGEESAAEGGERPGRERCQAEDPHPDCKSSEEPLGHILQSFRESILTPRTSWKRNNVGGSVTDNLVGVTAHTVAYFVAMS